MTVGGDTEPTREDVTSAAAAAFDDRSVSAVTPIDEGMNAVYRVAFDDGTDAVLKAGTATKGPKLLSGPILLERVARETRIPVPQVLAVVPEAGSSIGYAYVLMEYVDGRRITDVRELSPIAHERLVREAGRHLAAFHELPYDGQFGRLHADDGDLVPGYAFDSWPSAFRAEIDYHVDRIDDRFTDLEPAFRDGVDAFSEIVDDRPVDKAILYRDYHPKNLVLEPDDEATPLVRAVLDFNFRPVGDAPLDVAITEANLVDLPVGDTERAERLREALRNSYVEARGGTHRAFFDERYPYYRLLPILDYLNYFEYFTTFAREDDPEAVAERLREFVRERIDRP